MAGTKQRCRKYHLIRPPTAARPPPGPARWPSWGRVCRRVRRSQVRWHFSRRRRRGVSSSTTQTCVSDREQAPVPETEEKPAHAGSASDDLQKGQAASRRRLRCRGLEDDQPMPSPGLNRASGAAVREQIHEGNGHRPFCSECGRYFGNDVPRDGLCDRCRSEVDVTALCTKQRRQRFRDLCERRYREAESKNRLPVRDAARGGNGK